MELGALGEHRELGRDFVELSEDVGERRLAGADGAEVTADRLPHRQREAGWDHMARVRVSDATWADFRRAAGDRPLSRQLALLVARDVARWRAQRVRDGSADDAELLAAAEQARVLWDQLEQLVRRIEWRLDHRGAASCAGPTSTPHGDEPWDEWP